MRLGQNPAKFIERVAQPQRITVALVSYIPFLGGYYAESLEILKLCLNSLWQNTDLPYDLMIFDNASCLEVRNFLQKAHQEGRIQYLVLSDKNVGKGGGWNFIFGAAPGEFIAYADSDVYFFPGWLSAQIALFDKFPNLGMVTGAPLRVPEEFSTKTVEWAQTYPGASLERGVLLPWEDWWRHARSLGLETEAEGRRLYQANQDVCLTYEGKRYFIGAAHYQFVARKEVLQSLTPIPSERPMGQVRSLDIAINANGFLRLCTPEWWVQHLGNTLQDFTFLSSAPAAEITSCLPQTHQSGRGARSPWLRRLLLWLNKKTFDLLYRS